MGKRVWMPIYDNDPNLIPQLEAQDQSVVSEKKAKVFLKVNRHNGTLEPYLCLKIPVIDPQTQQVVGIYAQGLAFSRVSLTALLKHQEKNKHPDLNIKLSPREKQVIFLFLANLSSLEIAETIGKFEGKKISKSTIDSLFNDQLYIKFDVHSRPALYALLQERGYDRLIPKELLTGGSTELGELLVY